MLIIDVQRLYYTVHDGRILTSIVGLDERWIGSGRCGAELSKLLWKDKKALS